MEGGSAGGLKLCRLLKRCTRGRERLSDTVLTGSLALLTPLPSPSAGSRGRRP